MYFQASPLHVCEFPSSIIPLFPKMRKEISPSVNICAGQHFIYNNCYHVQFFSGPAFNKIASFEFYSIAKCPC